MEGGREKEGSLSKLRFIQWIDTLLVFNIMTKYKNERSSTLTSLSWTQQLSSEIFLKRRKCKEEEAFTKRNRH